MYHSYCLNDLIKSFNKEESYWRATKTIDVYFFRLKPLKKWRKDHNCDFLCLKSFTKGVRVWIIATSKSLNNAQLRWAFYVKPLKQMQWSLEISQKGSRSWENKKVCIRESYVKIQEKQQFSEQQQVLNVDFIRKPTGYWRRLSSLITIPHCILKITDMHF